MSSQDTDLSLTTHPVLATTIQVRLAEQKGIQRYADVFNTFQTCKLIVFYLVAVNMPQP